jgi:hypothetical protein
MHRRTLGVLALIIVTSLATSGCFRMARSAMRAGRSTSGNSSNQTKPEDLTWSCSPIDARATKKLDGYRAAWATYVEKYNAGDLTGAAQIAAVVDGINNAHWSEKPKPEDCQRPVGVAIGDLLAREAGVNWVLANGTTICLCSPTGKVLVGSVDIAETWLTTKTHRVNDLVSEIKNAVRTTTGEPIEIGTKPDVDESGEDMI